MKLHEIKLLEQYAKAKKDGIKPFEIRKNDRDFKVGDLVKYNYVDVIGVEAKDGTIISLGLIDRLLKEYEEWKTLD